MTFLLHKPKEDKRHQEERKILDDLWLIRFILLYMLKTSNAARCFYAALEVFTLHQCRVENGCATGSHKYTGGKEPVISKIKPAW